MITVKTFLECVQENVVRIREYQSGGVGSGGVCDCIGLIIGALLLAGEKWPGTHGSNYAARNVMRTLEPLYSPADLFLGEIVYKVKFPGDDGYNLPTRYDKDQDSKDYYHVGVVTSVNPLCITHCTSVPGGIKRDDALGQWRFGGELKLVEYAEDPVDEVLYQATVTAESGKTVRMRSQPSEKAGVLAAIKIGTVVDVLDEMDGWREIAYGGKTGYMMEKFLRPVGALDDLKELLQKALEIVEAMI